MNTYLDIIIRCVTVYFFMIIALRLFGKKEFSQLNPSDVILILLISNSVQNAMVGSNTSLYGGLVAATILFTLNFIMRKLMFKFPNFTNLVEKKPEILIHNGMIDFKTLSKLSITHDELDEAMREHGVENLKDVKLAMFEIDGNISIITGNKELKQTHYKRKRSQKNITRF